MATPESSDVSQTQWVRELYTLAFGGTLYVPSIKPDQFLCGSCSFLRFPGLENKGKYAVSGLSSGFRLLYFHFLLPTVFIFCTSYFAGVVALKIRHDFFLCV